MHVSVMRGLAGAGDSFDVIRMTAEMGNPALTPASLKRAAQLRLAPNHLCHEPNVFFGGSHFAAGPSRNIAAWPGPS